MDNIHYIIKGGQIYKAACEMKKAGYKKCQINRMSIRAYPDYYADDLPETGDAGWGSPAVWDIAKRLDIFAGCGNSHQAQCRITDSPIELKEFNSPEWLNGDPFRGGIIIDLENDEHERIQLDETALNLLYRE